MTAEQIGTVGYEMVLAFLQAVGQPVPPAYSALVAADKSAITADAQVYIDDNSTTPMQLHEANLSALKAAGWKWGISENSANKVGPKIISFSGLTDTEKAKMIIFRQAVISLIDQYVEPE